MGAAVDYVTEGMVTIDYRDPLHQKVLDRLTQRIDAAESANADERARWTRNEQLYSAYIDLETEDRIKQRNKQDKGRPEYVTLNIPYAYGMLLSAHTYITSTLFARDPIWDFRGRHGEGEQQVLAMNALISYQVLVGNILPSYYIWTHDSLRYGFGVIGTRWCKEMIYQRQTVEGPRTFLGIPIPGTNVSKDVIEPVPAYEGNKTYNVRPADFGWDPRFPVFRYQEGKFCTRRLSVNGMDIIDPDQFFNQKWIPFVGEGQMSMTAFDRSSSSLALNIPDEGTLVTNDTGDRDRNLPAHEVFVELIPNDWGIAKGKMPEKWVFLVLNRSLIVRARPLGSFANTFPFDVIPGEVEGYDKVPRSMLETTEALNNTLSWLFNSHMYNVRAALNNQLVVDPSRLMISDMLGPNPGKLIRAKPTAYGSDMRTAFSQLSVGDMTRSHLGDAQMVAQLMQRTAGINDNMMGQMASGRNTATETRAVNTMGISRMKTLVEFQSAVGYTPHAQRLVQNSQQYYMDPLKLRLVGDQLQNPNGFINIDPAAIAGFYDLIPVDGTMPVDRLAMVNTWQMLFQTMAGVPAILQQYDIGKIFAYVAQLAGIRDIKQFRVNIMPPGASMPSNVVPMPGMGGPSGPMAGPPGLNNSGVFPGPQIPGNMGPVS